MLEKRIGEADGKNDTLVTKLFKACLTSSLTSQTVTYHN